MENRSRRKFLFNFSMASLSLLPLTKAFGRLKLAGKIPGIASPATPWNCAADAPFVVDIHCHPNLKNYMLGRRMYRHLFHWNTKGTNMFNMQVDLKNLRSGNVKGLIAAHVLPERGMLEQARNNRRLLRLLRRVMPEMEGKMERGDESNYRQTLYMMDEFEAHIKKCNEKKPSMPITIAKSYQEFETIIATGQAIAVAQSIEGFHSLGRRLKHQEYLERLTFFAARGICLITPSHFFENDGAYQVEGIEPHEKKRLHFNWQYDPEYDNRGLTDIGKALVNHCFKLGIVVDLTHMTPEGRKDVFSIHQAFTNEFGVMRPLVFSHGGFQTVYDKYKPNPIPQGKKDVSNYKFKSPDRSEVKYIAKTDGVVGVMGENFWLTGNDNHTSYTDTELFEDGIKYIVGTIKALHDVTNCYRHISLGSDFDGFAKAPRDFRNSRHFKRLVETIQRDIPGCDINAITHCNAMRVLKAGWGNPVGL